MVVFCAPALANTIYVDDSAAGANSGTNWTDAYTDLQLALSVAVPDDQIHVAQGTYKPGTERTDSFQMKNQVAIYGGFPSGGGDFADRDIELYQTILSGDIGTTADNSDNSYHVFYHPEGTGLDATAVLDGVTITAGNANRDQNPSLPPHNHSDGGGMYNEFSNPTLTNCTFTDNTATYYGAGMFNDDSGPIVTNCTFVGNTADSGGGMQNWDSTPTLTDCTFIANTATYAAGGMCNWGGSPMITNCTFTNNTADYLGGGMYNGGSSPTITNCAFTGNTAMLTAGLGCFGGGMYNDYSGPIVTNSTFVDNTADSGGGIYNYNSSSPTVTNCILWENSDLQIHNSGAASLPVITYSDVQGGYTGTGNIDADPLFTTGPLGDYYLSQIATGQGADSPCLDTGGTTAAQLGMYIYTTRTDLVFDTGIVDMGCHYPGHINYADFALLSLDWLEDNNYILEIEQAAWWTFDEGAGTTAYDSSGYANHAALSDPPPTWTTGYIDAALDFNGTDNYVEVTGYKGVTGTASRTCSAWIKTTHAGAVILSWGDHNVDGAKWVFRTDSTGALRVSVGSGNIVGSQVVTDDNWHFVAAVLEDDGSPASNEIKLYVDGTRDINTIAVLQSITEGIANADVLIGAYCTASCSYCDGIIDDVRIYDVALTDEMIDQLYNGLTPGTLLCSEYPATDLNGDCAVDIQDLTILADNWLAPSN
jgi:Concanavalin A-like lectin/glucanases superfamily/Right handed beta helix region